MIYPVEAQKAAIRRGQTTLSQDDLAPATTAFFHVDRAVCPFRIRKINPRSLAKSVSR